MSVTHLTAPELAEGARDTRAARDRARELRRQSGAPAHRRRGRPSLDARPRAPWGAFPFSELTVLIALALMVAGFFTSGARGGLMLAAGLTLGSLAGVEVSIREHRAGYRAHSAVLASVVAVTFMTALGFVLGRGYISLIVAVGLAVFIGSFWSLREGFKRRSGGIASAST